MEDKFDLWFSKQLINAEILDPSYPVSGASSWFPHGYRLADNILAVIATELGNLGYGEIGLPSFVSIEHFRQQAQSIKDFLDRVYLACPAGSEHPQIIKSTIEAQISSIFATWLAEGVDPPFKVYTCRSVGRYEMGKTAPLRKERLIWPYFEAHCATIDGVETEMQHLDQATHAFCSKLCLPIMSVERLKISPSTQEYSKRCIQAISIMPSSSITLLSTIYDLGDRFSRTFGVGNEVSGYLDMVNFGFSGRLIWAVMGHNFRGETPIYPPAIAPFQVAVIPVRGNDATLADFALSIHKQLSSAGQRSLLISGKEAFHQRSHRATALGVPVHLFIGHKEVEANSVTISSPLNTSVESLPVPGLSIALSKKLAIVQQELWQSNLLRHNTQIVRAKTTSEITEAIHAKYSVLAPVCGDLGCMPELDQAGGEILGRLQQDFLEEDEKCVSCHRQANQTVLGGRKYRGER